MSTEADEALRRLRELSHDMRQPLAAVAALAAAARSSAFVGGAASEMVVECLDRIGDETTEILELCRHVLEDLRADVVVPAHVIAAEVVDRTARTTRCCLRFDASPCVIRADPIELRRVVGNLVENAVRAAGPFGTVDVSLRAHAGRVAIEVGDSGPGFGVAPRGIAGIGLTVVNRFAIAQGGWVELGRSRLGGALVRLVLPHKPRAADGQDLPPEALCGMSGSAE